MALLGLGHFKDALDVVEVDLAEVALCLADGMADQAAGKRRGR